MNIRFFDLKKQGVNCYRTILSELKNQGANLIPSDASMYVDVTLAGVIRKAIAASQIGDELKAEAFEYALECCSIRIDSGLSPDEIDNQSKQALMIISEGIKLGPKIKNCWQSGTNVLKEALYSLDEELKAKYGEQIDCSTMMYHMARECKSDAGADDAAYEFTQLTF